MLNLVPYHFVPLREKKSLSNPVNPFDKSLLEGKISCELTIKTPLFIPNTSGEPKARNNTPRERVFYSHTQLSGEISESPADPVIPGSSIRGMLRSVHEAASNGCLHILSGKRNDPHWVRVIQVAKNKGNFAPCTGKDDDLCPTCSLFGMVGRGDKEKTHAGRIRVSDAKAKGSIRFGEFRWLPPQMEPKVAAAEFYTYIPDNNAEKWEYKNEDLCLKGRKFYWHHQPVRNPEEERQYANNRFCRRVQPIEAGQFTFDIYFDGVTENELRQLAALVNLKGQDGYKRQFKLGNAKAQGYGSVETSVESIFIRRLSLKDGDILHQEENVTNTYNNTTMEEAFDGDLTDLMTILDPGMLACADVRVEYPSQSWYKNETSDDYSRSDYIFSHRLGTITNVKQEVDENPQIASTWTDLSQGNETQNPEPVQYSDEDMRPVDNEDEFNALVAKLAKPQRRPSTRASNKKRR